MPDNEDIPSPKWRDQALCKGSETDMYFPYSINRQNLMEVRKIISICEECPVKAECLYEAFMYDHEGIWGGTTKRQREKELPTAHQRKTVTLSQCKNILSNTSYKDHIPYSKKLEMYEN